MAEPVQFFGGCLWAQQGVVHNARQRAKVRRVLLTGVFAGRRLRLLLYCLSHPPNHL